MWNEGTSRFKYPIFRLEGFDICNSWKCIFSNRLRTNFIILNSFRDPVRDNEHTIDQIQVVLCSLLYKLSSWKEKDRRQRQNIILPQVSANRFASVCPLGVILLLSKSSSGRSCFMFGSLRKWRYFAGECCERQSDSGSLATRCTDNTDQKGLGYFLFDEQILFLYWLLLHR